LKPCTLRGFDGAPWPVRKSGAFKGCRQVPRSGAELHKPERSGGAEASGLEHGARAGISPINSKPLVHGCQDERNIGK
jgi:hypothetical protein